MDSVRQSPPGIDRVDKSLNHLFCCREVADCSNNLSFIDEILIRHLPERFTVHSVLGRGAFGIVYQAFDARLQRDVAIKILKPEWMANPTSRSRFVCEARAAARLNHSSIVRVLEADENDKIAWQVSDVIIGLTLRQLMDGQSLPELDAARIFADLADAVDCAHQAGIRHRDIKPENILVSRSGEGRINVHLTDFGLAKIVDDELDQSRSDIILGTPRYMAPEELCKSGITISPASDIFALGVTLFECLAGQNPFEESKSLTDRLSGSTRPTPLLRRFNNELSRDLEMICFKCMQTRPEDRYQSAGDLASDLRCYLSGLPIAARPRPVYERAWQFVVQNRVLVGAALAVLASLTYVAISSSSSSRIIRQQYQSLELVNQRLSSEIERADKFAESAEILKTKAESERGRFQDLAWLYGIREAYSHWEKGHIAECRRRLAELHAEHPLAVDRIEWKLLETQVNSMFPVRLQLDQPIEEIRRLGQSSDVLLACGDGNLRVLDSQSGKMTRQIPTGIKSVNAIAVDADGTRAWFGGSADGVWGSRLLMINLNEDSEPVRLATRPTTMESIIYSSFSNTVLCGSRYEDVLLADLTEDPQKSTFHCRSRNRAFACLGNTEKFVYQKNDRTVAIVDPVTRTSHDIDCSPIIQNSPIIYLTTIGKSPFLLLTAHSALVWLIDCRSWKVEACLTGMGNNSISCLLAEESLGKVAAGSNSGELSVWDLDQIPAWQDWKASNSEFTSESLHGSISVQIELEQVANFECTSKWLVTEGAILSLCMTHNWLICGSQEGLLTCVALNSRTVPVSKEDLQLISEPAHWIAEFSADGTRLGLKNNLGVVRQIDLSSQLTSPSNGTVTLHNWSDLLGQGEGVTDPFQPELVDGVAITGNGKTVVWPHGLSELGLMSSGKLEVIKWRSEDCDGSLVGVSPDGKLAVVKGADYYLHVISIEEGDQRLLKSVKLPGQATVSDWSSDSKSLLVGGTFNMVVEVSISTMSVTRKYDTPSNCRVVMYLGTDQAVLGLSDGCLRLMDLTNGSYKTLKLQSQFPDSIAATADQRIGFVMDIDCRLMLWHLPSWQYIGALDNCAKSAARGVRSCVHSEVWIAEDESRISVLTQSDSLPAIKSWTLK